MTVPSLESPIRIVGLAVDRLAIRLEKPLSISFLTLDWQEVFYVRLLDDQGNVGWGEGAPIQAITGDSLDEALAEAARLSCGGMPEFSDPGRFHEAMARRTRSHTLLAALDFAAHDLLARRLEAPVYRIYAPAPRLVPNSVTVFIQKDPEATAREAARLFDRHPHLRILKIKLKGAGDLKRCTAIGAVAPLGTRFILDANQGFKEWSEAVDVIGAIAGTLGELLLVEEPCRKGDRESMARVREGLRDTKVFADESCVDQRDLEAIIATACADGVNVKLQKAGGISAAKELASRAAEAGLDVMLGGMFETALSHSAGAHFAASTSNVILTDLDMDLDLPRFFHGRLPFEEGVRPPLEVPGFGFGLDAKRCAQLSGRGVLRIQAVARSGQFPPPATEAL